MERARGRRERAAHDAGNPVWPATLIWTTTPIWTATDSDSDTGVDGNDADSDTDMNSDTDSDSHAHRFGRRHRCGRPRLRKQTQGQPLTLFTTGSCQCCTRISGRASIGISPDEAISSSTGTPASNASGSPISPSGRGTARRAGGSSA